MLQEGELLIAGNVREIIACGPSTTAFGAEWRVGQDDIGFEQPDAHGGERIAQEQVAFDAVQHGVHQQQSVRVRYQLDTDKRLLALELLYLRGQVEEVIGALFDITISHDQETARAGCGVLDNFAWLWLYA